MSLAIRTSHQQNLGITAEELQTAASSKQKLQLPAIVTHLVSNRQ
jgi:hypothetical protein